MAHEIGNPLNSLNIHLQLAQKKLRKTPDKLRAELEEILEISQNEITRLDLIITDFLSAVRPTTPQMEACDVNQLIRESLQILEPEIRDRENEVHLELQRRLPRLQLDPNQMRQAFHNLIRNANQAMGSRGALKIQTELTDLHVVVRFLDDGTGISGEDMANVFQPYYTTKPRGSGLGLLIVRRIIREHGGEIELESELGMGTCVTCYLPLMERRLRLLEQKGAADLEVIDIEES